MTRSTKSRWTYRELSFGGRQQYRTPNSPLSSPAEIVVSRSGIPVIELKVRSYIVQLVRHTAKQSGTTEVTFRLLIEAEGFFIYEKLNAIK